MIRLDRKRFKKKSKKIDINKSRNFLNKNNYRYNYKSKSKRTKHFKKVLNCYNAQKMEIKFILS